jgi:hypothetical protein
VPSRPSSPAVGETAGDAASPLRFGRGAATAAHLLISGGDKMTAAPTLSRHDLEAKIVKRCWENDAFRREFVADPAGCFTKYLNAPKAKLPKITVHEEQPGSWHIVLPAKPAKAGELSDEELEKVAGGTDVVATITFVVASAVASGMISAGASIGATSGW